MKKDDAQQAWRDEWTYKQDRSANPFAKEAYALIESKNFKMLLDVGCGDGRDAFFFAEKGFEVTAVDFSESGIRTLRSLNPSIAAHQMDIRDMDFSDASFDVTYAHLSVHYFDDPTTTQIFQNLHRMLKSGGFLFVKCRSTKDPLFGRGEEVGKNIYRTNWVRHFFTVEYMKKKLEIFEIVEVREASAAYDGKQSVFIDAIAKKL